MPTIKPISELQRNFRAIADECHETRQPIYLTKNGYASLVVMDAEAFDETRPSLSDDLARYELERRISEAIERGREEFEKGNYCTLDEAIAYTDNYRKERE